MEKPKCCEFCIGDRRWENSVTHCPCQCHYPATKTEATPAQPEWEKRLAIQFKDVWEKHPEDPDLIEDFEYFFASELLAQKQALIDKAVGELEELAHSFELAMLTTDGEWSGKQSWETWNRAMRQSAAKVRALKNNLLSPNDEK